MTNAQSKSMLAKLLATENITIRRNSNARTASFDVKNRVLEMPVWRNVSEDLEDLLTVHETGHALDTPCEGWLKAIEEIAKKYHEKPSNRHTMAVKGFLNVIEDARIDKRQKRRYPGSRRNYLAGYKELLDRGFFGPPGTDFNTYNFIDRLNVYFKGGVSLGIKFSSDEKPFVKKIENAETFQEVLTLTDEIYGFCKSKGEDQKRNTIDDMEYEESKDDDDYDGDYEDFDVDEDGSDSEDDTYNTKNGKDGTKSMKSKKDFGDKAGSGSNGTDDDFVPESKTEKTWQEKQLELSDTNTEYVYVTIPKPVMKNIVDDYKVVLKQYDIHNKKQDQNDLQFIAKSFVDYKSSENNTISFMVKEFEMRKSADLYSKISIAKTGVIDTNKLHSYRYNDDIFRRLTVIPQGKNHGFIMFLDWSGSMSANFGSTLKQLISMVLFCKRVQIPFEVYSFRDLNNYEATGSVSASRSDDTNHCFEYKKGDMLLSSFKLRNILSSRMSITDLNRAFINLWMFSTYTNNQIDPMSGTPLNSAIIAATELVNQFRDRNKLQIVNTIFLTDGDSNGINGINGIHQKETFATFKKRKYILQDDVTKKEFFIGEGRVEGRLITDNLLRHLKSRTDCNLIGFYLYSTYSYNNTGSTPFLRVYREFFGFDASTETKHYDDLRKYWIDNKYIPVTTSGYDEYFIIDSRIMDVTKDNLHIDHNMSKSKIVKQFLNFSSKKAINRILLQRFISLTSSSSKVA
jgi:hypothetical protein